MGFDPSERPEHYAARRQEDRFDVQAEQHHASERRTIPPEVAAEIERLDRADLLILQYPMWWHLPPAMLKGWFDRVLIYGEVYASRKRFEQGRFVGKRALLSLTVGTSPETYAFDGRSGDIDLLLWPVNFSLAYVGYTVLAPAYPGLEVEVEALRADPSSIERVTIPATVEHLEGIIREGGILNTVLLRLGLISQPLKIMRTSIAVYLGIIYSYLPFMVLPLFATLEKLDNTLLEAAADLGSPPWRAFLPPMKAARKARQRPPPGEEPFWRRKTLAEMSRVEWESLCDGCGKCCLLKLEYEDTGEIDWTNIACRQLDPATCRCRNYALRKTLVEDCVSLTPDMVGNLAWLPATCAYRLVDEGRDDHKPAPEQPLQPLDS